MRKARSTAFGLHEDGEGLPPPCLGPEKTNPTQQKSWPPPPRKGNFKTTAQCMSCQPTSCQLRLTMHPRSSICWYPDMPNLPQEGGRLGATGPGLQSPQVRTSQQKALQLEQTHWIKVTSMCKPTYFWTGHVPREQGPSFPG